MSSVDNSNFSIHMDVLCLKKHLDYILAGIGNKLFIYKNHSFMYSALVFLDERIHDLFEDGQDILVKGVKQLALVRLEESDDKVICHFLNKILCLDWIHAVIKLSDNLIGLATSHNLFEIWNLSLEKKVNVKSCTEECLLYSCKIIQHESENIIFSGTVFGDILIWNPFCTKKNLLGRLKAHNGAVFSIEINIRDKVFLSTSDDRSLKVWSLQFSKSSITPYEWEYVLVKPLYTLFGHTARVWKSLILSNFYVTIGEDSQLIIWNKNGTIFKKLVLHQESGIRSLSFSKEKNEIFTGGEDGGINVISCKNLTCKLHLLLQGKVINSDKNFSAKLCFVKNGFIYTTFGQCILVREAQEEVIYENNDFLKYCIIEVSFLGDYIALGSIKGHLVIINIEKKSVIVEGKYLDGRVYSIHWLNEHILTCGPNGTLNLWKITDNQLMFLKSFILPQSKERWTTCALIHNYNLVIGDRMGNIHVYSINDKSEKVKTFLKIHKYLGVTDITFIGKNILSIGRDGTLKCYSEALIHLSTTKLPMEWPWKIITYKSDVLILGFHSTFLIVYSLNFREVVTSFECGGGHRACHYVLCKDILKFIYIKEKKIFQVDLSLKEIKKLRNGFHSKEINILKIVQSEPLVVVTGSEDTTVRISFLSKSDVETRHVLKTHLSNVRAVATCPFDNEEINNDNILIASAGGKAQIILWKFDLKANEYLELFNYRLKSENRNWKCPEPPPDPETRFMCIDILKNKTEFLIFAGGSDRHIRIFSFIKGCLSLLQSKTYTHCILKLFALKLQQYLYVISMATDGKITIWRFSPQNFELIQCESFGLHQSGINSFDFKKVEPDKLIIITGGDDNKVIVSFIELSEEVKLTKLWSNCSVHSCQVTGIVIIKNFFLTTSIDQRITLWEWSYDTKKFEVQYKNQMLTAVPDVQGLAAKWCLDNTLLAIVYGKGIESLKFDCNDLDVN